MHSALGAIDDDPSFSKRVAETRVSVTCFVNNDFRITKANERLRSHTTGFHDSVEIKGKVIKQTE
jgi:hypothetical protein